MQKTEENQKMIASELEAMLDELIPDDRTLEGQKYNEEVLKLGIDNLFSYHAPQGTQAQRYEALRNGAKMFAKMIIALTPSCPDQTAAIRKLRECVMTANAAIACYENAIPEDRK